MAKNISEERQMAYYIGGGLMVIGGLHFFSVFITGAMNFGNFSNFEANAQSSMTRALGGMAFLFIGGIVRGIGAKGLAGSGVVLDPEKARDELEPYSRMAGGMVKDAMDEADIHIGGQPERVVMLKCRACSTLNTDDSTFCKACGQKM